MWGFDSMLDDLGKAIGCAFIAAAVAGALLCIFFYWLFSHLTIGWN